MNLEDISKTIVKVDKLKNLMSVIDAYHSEGREVVLRISIDGADGDWSTENCIDLSAILTLLSSELEFAEDEISSIGGTNAVKHLARSQMLIQEFRNKYR